MTHYELKCRNCKEPTFVGVGNGPNIPVSYLCPACSPGGGMEVGYVRKPGLAPCCKSGKCDGDPRTSEN